MAVGVIGGLVLVEVVEQSRQGPPLLVLPEVAAQTAHHALHADKVAVRGVLVGLLPGELPGLIDVHLALAYWSW